MQNTFDVKNDVAKQSRITLESECMKGSVIKRSDIKMQPRLSILNTNYYIEYIILFSNFI